MIQSRSLFVKNLNFKTSDESLKKHFIEHVKKGKILSVKVIFLVLINFLMRFICNGIPVFLSMPGHMQVKKHLKNGKNVSMGFGFIEFDSVETATNVCADLQVLTDIK